MNERVEIKTAIEVPPRLISVIEALVIQYAEQHREAPVDCRRAVEIAVFQLGVRALEKTLGENKRLGDVMGWPKEEESGV